jgi:hypothetical protein
LQLGDGALTCLVLVLPEQNIGIVENTTADVSRRLLDLSGSQPRMVLRVVRRIECAAAWFDARIAGMDRAAAHLLRAQRPSLAQIEAEVALESLRRPR